MSPQLNTSRASDDPSREREFDALYVGTRAVLLNQTKSTVRMNDVRPSVGHHWLEGLRDLLQILDGQLQGGTCSTPDSRGGGGRGRLDADAARSV